MQAYCLCFLLATAAATAALAQTESKQAEVRRFDVNGNAIAGGSSSETKTTADGRTVQVEYGVDANGRRIPLQSVEEVKTQRPGGVTTIERVVKQFDQNGNQVSSERSVSERRALGEKRSESSTTVYRTDLNGNEAVTERQIAKTNEHGGTVDVLRAGFDGALAVAERQVSETSSSGAVSKTNASTFRRDANGNLYEVVRTATESQQSGDRTVDSRSVMVNRGDGTFGLTEQTVTVTTERPDGTVTRQVELYGEQAPGTTNEGGRPVLKERQTIEVVRGANGTQVERVTSQKATANEGGRLSEPQVIQETVTSTSKK